LFVDRHADRRAADRAATRVREVVLRRLVDGERRTTNCSRQIHTQYVQNDFRSAGAGVRYNHRSGADRAVAGNRASNGTAYRVRTNKFCAGFGGTVGSFVAGGAIAGTFNANTAIVAGYVFALVFTRRKEKSGAEGQHCEGRFRKQVFHDSFGFMGFDN